MRHDLSIPLPGGYRLTAKLHRRGVTRRVDPSESEVRNPLAPTQENLDWAHDRIGELTERAERAQRHADELALALRLTQEYVGDQVLPPIDGWSWYDALQSNQRYHGHPPGPPWTAAP